MKKEGSSKCKFLYLRKVTNGVLEGSALFNKLSNNLEKGPSSKVQKFTDQTVLFGF